jgi:hypothetical protein
MFSSTDEVFSADAKDQIMCITKNLNGFPKNESIKITELLQTNDKIGYGYVTVPIAMSDALILNAIRYKDTKDIYFKHLISWFEVDFAWYDKELKQVMIWGEIEKVKDSIAELKNLLENTLLEELHKMIVEEREKEKEKEKNLKKEREWQLQEREDRDYDPFKHT